MRKSHWISLVLALVVAGLVCLLEQRRSVYFLHTPPATRPPFDYSAAFFIQRLEWAAYDWRFKILGDRKPHPDVAIVAIDEKSLQELHQWPWPRGIHARLIEALAKNPPKALAFDVLFLEPYTLDPAGDRALMAATQHH